MNKVYNYVWPIDNRIAKSILRFYQSSVLIPEYLDREKIEGVAELNKYDIPECALNRIPFSRISLEDMAIVYSLKSFIDRENTILFLPIYTVVKSTELEAGHYVIDFDSKELVYYKHLDVEKTEIGDEGDSKILSYLSYFVDLHKCIFLYEDWAFVEGVHQIGSVSEYIKNSLVEKGFSVDFQMEAQQVYSHALGINCREQLFVRKQRIFKV